MALNLETLSIQFEVRDNTGKKIRQLQQRMRQLEGPELEVNTEAAENAIDELRDNASDEEIEARVTADTSEAEREIRDLSGAADRVDGGSVNIGGDTSNFDDALDDVEGSADGTDGGDVDIGGDSSDFDKELDAVEGSADGTDGGSADIGGDSSDFDDALDDVEGSADGTDGGSADIGGDTSDFDDALDEVESAADGTDGGDADIGGDTSDFDDALDEVEGAADDIDGGDVEIDGDTTDVDADITRVKRNVRALPNGDVDINADASDATNDIDNIEGRLEDIESPDITPEVDLSKAETGFQKLRKMMIAAGLLEVGKSAFEFAMSATDAAYTVQANKNQILNKSGEEGLAQIEAYAAEMHEKYGFNEGGLIAMAQSFLGTFVGANLPADEAIEKAIELSNLAIDYASAMDMTPGEVADKFSGLFQGSTEMAESVGIYTLSADSIQAKVDEMLGLTALYNDLENAADDTKKAEIQAKIAEAEALKENNLPMYEKLAIFSIIKETADGASGITGDWERTAHEYGNQMTMIGERWQSIKEQIGTYLLPLAEDVVGAISSIMGAIEGLLSGENGSFVSQFGEYMGTADMSDAEIKELVDGVVGPVKAVATALETASAELNTAITNHETAASKLMTMLQKHYIGSTTPDGEEIESSFESFFSSGNDAIEQSESSLIAMFMAFAGTEEEWTTATNYAISGIQAYYQGIKDEFGRQSEELKKIIDESIADNVITAEEMAEIRRVQAEASQTLIEGITIDSRAAASMRADDFVKAGDYSAGAINRMIQDVEKSSAESKALLNTEYDKMREHIYKVAEYNQAWYKRDPEGYLEASGGVKPQTAQEMLAETDKWVEDQLLQMDADAESVIARALHASLFEMMRQNVRVGEEAPLSIFYTMGQEEAGADLKRLESYAERFRKVRDAGGELGQEALDIIDLYNFFVGHGSYLKYHAQGLWEPNAPEEFGWKFLEKFYPDSYENVVEAMYNLSPELMEQFYPGHPPEESESSEIPDEIPTVEEPVMDALDNASSAFDAAGEAITSASETFSSAASQIPESISIESHIYVDGYELGKTTESSLVTYNQSTMPTMQVR